MKVEEWKTYRTRFLVKARQLNSSLSFTDSLGRHHSGRKGDYLVESSEGMLCIHPRKIFEDVYVAMSFEGKSEDRSSKDRSDIAYLGESAAARRKLPQPAAIAARLKFSAPQLSVLH